MTVASMRALPAAQDPPAGADDGLRELLERLRHTGDGDLDHRDAAEIFDRTWDALAAVVADSSEETRAPLLAALTRLRELDDRLTGLAADGGDTARQLSSVLAQLEEADCTVAELVGLAPQLICDLGFERAIISHIEDGLWIPQTVFVTSDPLWAAEIQRAGQEQPQALGPGLLETEMVRRRSALLVRNVQDNPRVNRPIADASLSRSYVAAPLLSRGRVVGALHADRYGQTRDVDGADRELLVAFSQGLRLALSRAALAERLEETQRGLRALSDTLATTDPRAIALVSSGRGVLGAVHVPAERAHLGTAFGDLLTRREVEVLGLMAEGRTNAAIAQELVVAESTVKQHVKHILRKVGAGNRAEAISLWFQAQQSVS